MNRRKERGRLGGRKGRNRGGYPDPEAIWLSCSVRLLAKICPELNLTLGPSLLFFPSLPLPQSYHM